MFSAERVSMKCVLHGGGDEEGGLWNDLDLVPAALARAN